MYWVLGTSKLISNSGFFLCMLLSAERQALGPLVNFLTLPIPYDRGIPLLGFSRIPSYSHLVLLPGFQKGRDIKAF
jgi:hypothetical protein